MSSSVIGIARLIRVFGASVLFGIDGIL